jgi:ElaA protein
LRYGFTALAAMDAPTLYRVLALRAAVFVVEQRCAYLDPDGLDGAAWHLLGWDGDALAAYLRVLPPAGDDATVRIGRVVVAPSHRGQGLGRAVMIEGLRRIAAVYGAVPVALSAQAHLRRFYGDLGFEVVGPGYDEDGIPHLPMRRQPGVSATR